MVSPDPSVASDQLGGLQGDVIVEVTIDEKGNIVQKVVIQSLGPAIDGKVLEALENWRFRPATRNGVAYRIQAGRVLPLSPPRQRLTNVDRRQRLPDFVLWPARSLALPHPAIMLMCLSDQVRQVASADFPTRWGKFRIYGFRGEFGAPGQPREEEAVALVMGRHPLGASPGPHPLPMPDRRRFRLVALRLPRATRNGSGDDRGARRGNLDL